MRLSDFAPRINGMIPPGHYPTPGVRRHGIHGLGDLNTVVSMDLIAYINSGSTPVTPEYFASVIQGEVASYCGTFGCDAASMQAAQLAITQYKAWYAGVPLQQQSGLTAATQNYLSSDGAAPPPTANPNVLDNVAPTGTSSVSLNKGQYNVGDTFQLTIVGPPNQPVSVVASHNGVTAAQTQMGTTDSSGRFSITGTMTVDTVGNWSENWYVGNTPAGNVSFSVMANALKPPVTVPPVTAGQVLNNQTQGGSGATAAGTSGSNVPAPSNAMLDWLTQPISASIPIPMWGVLAAGVVAVMVMKD